MWWYQVEILPDEQIFSLLLAPLQVQQASAAAKGDNVVLPSHIALTGVITSLSLLSPRRAASSTSLSRYVNNDDTFDYHFKVYTKWLARIRDCYHSAMYAFSRYGHGKLNKLIPYVAWLRNDIMV
jgi:hypothetical protein